MRGTTGRLKSKLPLVLRMTALLLTVAAWSAEGGTLLAIGSDPINFVPDQLVLVDTAAPGVTTLATLGDGSLGFNGGLTYGPGGLLYGIGNDSSGAGSLYQIQMNGTLTLVGLAGGLGFGFYGGLTFDSGGGLFYAAANDSNGDSSLYSITAAGMATPLGTNLDTGFSGLALDSANALFYGIGNDSTGLSTLYQFTASGPVNPVTTLGYGFGGLTYDAAPDLFWVISPVSNSGAQLFQVTAAGAQSGPSQTLGDGFFELAAPEASPASVPEPGTWMAGAGCLMLAAFMQILRRKS